MIKILYALNGVFNKGGTEAVVLSYFNNIDKNKYHIDFLLHGNAAENHDNPIHKYLIEQGSQIFYVTPRGESYHRNIQEIRSVLKKNHYDIVHSHMDSSGMFFLREAKKAGVKVRISHSHNTNNQINNFNKFKALLYRIVLWGARKRLNHYTTERIACSELAGEWLFGRKSFVVLNNAIDISKFNFNERIRKEYRNEMRINDKFVVGHVGRFAEQKNHEFLIDVFNELLKLKPNSILMLVGDGELRTRIEDKVKKLGIFESVIFLGNRNDVENLMQAMDILVLPSKFEGLAVVLIEAQAAGLFCVTSNNIAKESAILAANIQLPLHEQPSFWANCIATLNLDISRSEAAKQIKKKGFDIIDIIKQLELIYKDDLEK